MSPDDPLAIIIGFGLILVVVCVIAWGLHAGHVADAKRKAREALRLHDEANARRALIKAHRPDG